jgi:hypothetical protein
VELVVVPWAPGPLLRIEGDGPPSDELRRPSGLPIDPSDPDVGALIEAYEAVLATRPPHDPAVIAAHTAVLETASLLRWEPPTGPAEREYVRRRTRALGALAGPDPSAPLEYLRAALAGE